MALTKCTVPGDVIGSLGTTVEERGITTQQFKDAFDQMPEGIKTYLNDTLTVELDALMVSAPTANKLVLRDASGRAKVAAPSASDDIARKAEIDVLQAQITETISQGVSSKSFPTANDDDKAVSTIWTIPSTLPSQLINLLEAYGNFAVDSDSDGLADGWTIGAAAIFTLSDNIQSCTPYTQYSGFKRSLVPQANHIYYTTTLMKTTSNLVMLYMHDGVTYFNKFLPSTGDFQRYSVRGKYGSSPTTNTIGIQDNRTSGWDKIEVKKTLQIDLTERYGAGNEPSLGEMDALIESLGGYFSNTIDYSKGTGRVYVCVSNATGAAVWREITTT